MNFNNNGNNEQYNPNVDQNWQQGNNSNWQQQEQGNWQQPKNNLECNPNQNFNQQYQEYNQNSQMRHSRPKRSNVGVVICLLLFFWPGGMYYMWKDKHFNKGARIAISIIIPILVTLKIIGKLM